MMNKFYSLNSGVFVLVFLAGWAAGAQVEQHAPVIPANADYVSVNIRLINDDPGAIYNRAELDAALLGGLAEQLWGLPVNPYTYETMQEMMAEWTLNVRSPPTGDVYSGWSATVGGVGPDAMTLPLGQVVLTHGPFGYDLWTSSAGRNTMWLTLRIPLFQLDVDGVVGYDPSRDARLSVGAAAVPQAFVAMSTSGFTIWSAPAFSYEVVWPEVDCAAANVSGSGTVGLADVALVAAMWLETGLFLPEDITKDGRVDLDDLAQIARWWGEECEF